MSNNRFLTDKILWRSQGVFALIVLLAGSITDYVFFMCFYTSGLRTNAIHDFILSPMLGTIIIVLIIIGSFYKWRLSLILAFFQSFFAIKGFYAVFFFPVKMPVLVYCWIWQIIQQPYQDY